MRIPVEAYLAHALDLRDEEKRLVEEFSLWLPNTIIDCHVHLNPPESLVGIDDALYRNMITTFPWFSIEQHKLVTSVFYPNKRVILLSFTMPYRGINFRLANGHILELAAADKDVKPILYGIPDDIDYTVKQLTSGRFFGLKMYMLYFEPPATRINQYFPDEILTFLDKIHGTAILHLPAPIVLSYEEVINTAQRFPEVQFVIAHMGSVTDSSQEIEQCYRRLEKISNLMFDTALVCSADALKLGLNIFGHKRIIYGTDQPLSLVRANAYINPALGERLATSYPYHWIDPNEQRQFASNAKNSVHLHWDVLRKLRESISDYGETTEVLEDIFCNNAERIFKL